VTTPYFGVEFEYKLGWVQFEQKTGERTPTPRRMLFDQWLPGENYEDFEGAGLTQPPSRDLWGRTFMEGETDELSWHGRTADGTFWELCLLDPDTLQYEQIHHYPRYELRRNGDSLTSFVAAEASRPAIAAAWIRGDSCVVEYRFSAYEKIAGSPSPVYHTILLNGENLNRKFELEQMSGLCYFGDTPFYLLQRNGKWGWSFGGVETLTEYDELFFDQCCEPGMWNPYFERSGFELITRRGSEWYLLVGRVDTE
jgi:hypothetical protein